MHRCSDELLSSNVSINHHIISIHKGGLGTIQSIYRNSKQTRETYKYKYPVFIISSVMTEESASYIYIYAN